MSARSRQIVYRETAPLEMAAAELDLDRLRRAFAELFDRAARAVQLAGYEQDDAVFERFLVARTVAGEEVSVAAEWFADRDRLLRQIEERLDCGNSSLDQSGVRITAIRIAAVLEAEE